MRIVFLTAAMLCAGAAWAQTDSPQGGMAPMPGMKPGVQSYVPLNPAVRADQDAMKTMMAGMNAPYSGDADQDFVSHMMPHHQGAIDMAEVELKYGSDPKLKALAGRIVADQQREITFMQAWQKKHPAAAMKVDNPHIQYK
jgi:uncharacterized protein (DUF305 family)